VILTKEVDSRIGRAIGPADGVYLGEISCRASTEPFCLPTIEILEVLNGLSLQF
jgi:hypothetical protein